MEVNKLGVSLDKNKELSDFIYPFLINELLHSNEIFLNKLGEEYLQKFLNDHNKDNIFK